MILRDEVELHIGADVSIMPFAVLGHPPLTTAATRRQPEAVRHVWIGARCRIASFATIYAGARIGADCLIGSGAVVREGVVIGDRCVIGAGVEVNYETVLGDDCRVMSKTHLTGRMVIGDGSFFGVGVVTSNDRRIDLDDYAFHPERIAGPQIGRKVMVGSGANLLAGISVGDGAVIGAGALVVRDVPASARIYGTASRCLVQEGLT